MAKIADGALKTWHDGDVVTASDYQQEREMMRTAVNDNFDRIGNVELIVNGYSIKGFGAKVDGVTDDTEAVQSAIDNVPYGSQVFFPPGTTLISSITLKEGVTLIGAGWTSVIKVKDGTNPTQAITIAGRYDRYNQDVGIRNLQVDGNKGNNTSGHGIYLESTNLVTLENVRVANCRQTGIYWSGNGSIHSNTNYINECSIYECDGYGLYISAYCDDMHVTGGDYGSNNLQAVYLESPSSSIHGATIWGSKTTTGLYISSSAPSVQIMNCQVEGHAKHGIEVVADHCFISGNKVYDNANIPANYGQFSGIYVGDGSTNVQNTMIVNNAIYSGLYASTGYHKAAIELALHTNATVIGNATKYLGNGVVDSSRPQVLGLLASDVSDVDLSMLGKYSVAVGATSQALTANTDVQMTLSPQGNSFPLDTSWGSSNWTCPTAGVYEIDTNIMVNTGASSLTVAKLFVNSTSVTDQFLYSISAPSAQLVGAGSSTIKKLNVGDVLRFYVNNSAAGATIAGNYSRINIKRIG